MSSWSSSGGSTSFRDVAGRKVCTLEDGVVETGRHELTWNGVNNAGNRVTSGIYFCRMETGKVTQMLKMVLLR